jgi:hypothetical protein
VHRAETWIGAQLVSTQTLTPGIRECTLVPVGALSLRRASAHAS